MRYTGLKYILNNIDYNINDLLVGFDFQENQSISNIVFPNFWAPNSASGILDNTLEFYQYSGTGYFNGNTLMELNKPLVLGSNSTLLFSFEKLRQGNEILISSITGNSINNYSGFCIGVNDANKLYFTYWNPVEGPFTFTYNNILSNKNLIILNKSGPIISIGKYNNNNFNFEVENFQIKNNVFRENNKIFIGGNSQNTFWASGSKFSGYVDNFYLFNNIPFFYSELLASGIFSSVELVSTPEIRCFETGVFIEENYEYLIPTGIGLQEVVTTEFQITGYETLLTGYNYIKITGYEKIIFGTGIDNCGVEIELFYNQPLSGLVYEEYTIQNPLYANIDVINYIQTELSGFVTGVTGYWQLQEICEEIGRSFETIEFINNSFLNSLSFSEISLLKQEDYPIKNKLNENIIEIYLENYQPTKLYYNENIVFDRINLNYTLPNDIEDLLLFANGQLLINNGYNILESGYDNLIIPITDYMITGDRVETNNFFTEEFDLFYDNVSGNLWAFKNTGNIINIPEEVGSNYWVFRNGQKLIKDKDYSLNNLTIQLINVPNTEENNIIIKEIPDNFIYYSGNINSLKLTGVFNNGCSQVYYNGIKQKINNNYLENSAFDFISGRFYENESNYIIYDSTEEFFV
jgi:hypothetical protein